MLLSLFAAALLPSALAASLSDMTGVFPYEDAVRYVQERGVMPSGRGGSFRPYRSVTRAELAEAIVRAVSGPSATDGCDPKTLRFRDGRALKREAKEVCVAVQRGWMKGYEEPVGGSTFRPRSEVTLGEAAAVLLRAFGLPSPDASELREVYTQGDGILHERMLPWFKAPLVALGKRGAIPRSFFHPRDPVSRGELAEMMYRLKEGVIGKSSLAYDTRWSWPETPPALFLRLYGDFSQPLPASAITRSHAQSLANQPGFFIITDVAEGEEVSDQCRMFSADAWTVTSSLDMDTDGVPRFLSVEWQGATDPWCGEIVTRNVDYEESCSRPQLLPYRQACSCRAGPDGQQECNIRRAQPRRVAFTREGERIAAAGIGTNRIRIVWMPLSPLPYVWGSDGPFYDHVRVDTEGRVEQKILPSGEGVYTYRTPWRPIFRDLRGVPNLMVFKELPGGRIQRTFYDAPAHNRGAYGQPTFPYSQCVADPEIAVNDPFEFCFGQEGGDFLVASRVELTQRMTLWIDPHFKR